MKILKACDLSHPITTGMPVYPGDPAVTMAPAATISGEGYNVLHLSMGSQSGTHIDAPFHFLDHGSTIDSLPLDVFFAEAVIADATGLAPNAAIGPEVIPEPGFSPAIVLIRTDWSQHWGTEDYFSHPYLSVEAAHRIVELGFSAVAIDALSIDQTHASTGNFDAHMVILGANIPVAENLRGIAAIDWSRPWVSLLPLHLQSADGAPIRAVAFQLDGH